MIDRSILRDNPDLIKAMVKDRGLKLDIDKLLLLDKEVRDLTIEVESLRQKQNKANDLIANANDAEKKAKIAEMRKVSDELKGKETKLKEIKGKYDSLLNALPNIVQDDVPVGKDDSGNKMVREVGEKPKFDFKPKDYLTIAEKQGWVDMKSGGKVSGTRFGYLKGDLVKLQLALMQYAFDTVTKEGTTPVLPPVMVKDEVMRGMGYIDQGGDEEVYKTAKDGLRLVGTSEQSIIPMHANDIIDEKDLPLRYVGYSTCFRREAGSYGKDTKGMLRSHQFDKVEMISITKPEDSEKEHQRLLALQEKMVSSLGIPYRVVLACTGDLGFPSAKTYDLECWMPGQNKYRETHSTSNTTDFQARRLKIRYRDKSGKVQLVHTLNATAFAMGRIIIAIIENFQKKDGLIDIPASLKRYIADIN